MGVTFSRLGEGDAVDYHNFMSIIRGCERLRNT
jgi:hypothetical protein